MRSRDLRPQCAQACAVPAQPWPCHRPGPSPPSPASEKLAGLRLQVEEIALTAASQRRKLEVVLGAVNRALQVEEPQAKWSVEGEPGLSQARAREGRAAWCPLHGDLASTQRPRSLLPRREGAEAWSSLGSRHEGCPEEEGQARAPRASLPQKPKVESRDSDAAAESRGPATWPRQS